MRFKDAALYLDTFRECYEAYVVYNFMAYLRNFLVTEYDLEATLEMRPQVQHLWPVKWVLPTWKNGRCVQVVHRMYTNVFKLAY